MTIPWQIFTAAALAAVVSLAGPFDSLRWLTAGPSDSLSSLKAAPQDPKQPPIRTQANYVRVDVYPLSGGRPLSGLRVEDFEVLEDGVPQAIQNFEYIQISAGGPQAQRIEPNTVGAARQAAANPRNRTFVIFLDVNNVSIEGTWNVRGPLVKLVESILGPEDLVALMTPDVHGHSRGAVMCGVVLETLKRAYPS